MSKNREPEPELPLKSVRIIEGARGNPPWNVLVYSSDKWQLSPLGDGSMLVRELRSGGKRKFAIFSPGTWAAFGED